MNGHDPIDDALDAAIDALQRGRPLDAVLYDQRPHGSALLPLLQTAEAVRAAPPAPPPDELHHNYVILQAAVERARTAQAGSQQTAEPAQRRWWGRRLTFASLSIPAGAAALMLTAGAAGATASVMTTDLGASVAHVVLPDALADQLPGKSGDAPGHNKTPDGAAPSANPASPGDDTPGADNMPAPITVSGTISDVNGGTFTLTNGDGTWRVQTDVNTEISGEILEGGTADVSGAVTAEKNVHATGVSASGGTPDASTGTEKTRTPNPNAAPAGGDSGGPPGDPAGDPPVPPLQRPVEGSGTGDQSDGNATDGEDSKP